MKECRVRRAFGDVLADEYGGIAIMAALMMPLLIGGMGLGAETGYWYMKQRKLQHAADMAAFAGAIRMMQGDERSAMEPTAKRVGQCTWDNDPLCQTSPVTVTITINTPFGGDDTKVEAIAEETLPRYLTALFGSEPVSISARAVAKFTLDTGAKGCVLALNKTAPVGVKVSGTSSVAFNGCEVVSNSGSDSSFMMQSGSAVITTDCIRLSGEASTNAGADINLKCERIAEHRPEILDPYEEVPEPEIVGSCAAKNVGNPNSTVTVAPSDVHPGGLLSRNYCEGMDIKGTVRLRPGIYLIGGGGLKINAGANISVLDDDNDGVTEGVMFFMYDQAPVTMNGDATLNLSPITAAQDSTYSGLLFFASRTNTAQQKINGGSSSSMSGVVYAPAADVQFSGNTSNGTGGCMQLVGATIEFTGSSGVAADCSSIGGRTIHSNPTAALYE